MSKIINQYKYIIDLDPKLSKIIPSSSVFVSHRSAKTLKDLLISSKLPAGTPNNNSVEHDANPQADLNSIPRTSCNEIDKFGTKSCDKCYLCKNYLQVCNQFSSYHTEQIFRHKSELSCKDECIIYLCECVTHKISYTGYTITSMKTRFSNNKSHIKCKNASCEFVKHFIEVEHSDIDFSNRNSYDTSLSNHVRVTIIERVIIDPGASKAEKEAICEEREGYWQTQLKTLHVYGGLNVRDNRKYVSLRSQKAGKI